MIDRAREIALKVLYDVNINEAYSNIALDEALKQARKNQSQENLNQRDIGFISEIVYGTISWRLTIDEVIKKYSNVRMKKISPWILNILRMSVYQILFLDKVPKSAAVNEGVNLAKRYGHRASSNFVNAILRKVDKKDYEEFFEIKDDVERISKTTSMPVWIVEELLKQNSIEKVEQICKDSNLKPNLCVRVNQLKNDKQTLMKELKAEGINAKDESMEDFLILEGAKNIEGLKAFKEGKFTVQDEAAGYIPKLLNPKQNEKVLDACSSPGGKTTYMAEIMKNQGEIKAWDLHEHRVKLVEKAANRLGITIIKTEVNDATIYEEKYFEYFDKILLDVPCLGIGVLKRKPDIKWKRKKEDIEEITKIQEKILENCSKYLKKGGELVYSTCSILDEENTKVINNFIKNNKNFEIEKIDDIQEEFFKKFVEQDQFIQVYQNEKTDGFFICKMRKNEQKT
jgi:16S rRNA (cytosine967-C5)-methyltransferase